MKEDLEKGLKELKIIEPDTSKKSYNHYSKIKLGKPKYTFKGSKKIIKGEIL